MKWVDIMKEKEKISYESSTKTKMAVYSLIAGIFGIVIGSIIAIMGVANFLGEDFTPLEIRILRDGLIWPLILENTIPGVAEWFAFIGILGELDPYNKAFMFSWPTPMLIIDIIKPDIFLGICMALIGAVFLVGVKPLFQNKDEGVSFLVGGSLLSIGYGIIYLLIMLAHGAMFLLGNEDFLTWNILSDFSPAIWYALLAIPGGIITWQIRNVK